MKSRRKSGLWLFIVIATFLLHCDRKEVPGNFSYQIKDYIHGRGTHSLFSRADSLKYSQDYANAAQAFEEIIKSSKCSKNERIYALNQLAFIALEMRETEQADRVMKMLEPYVPSFSKIQRADYLYNLGVKFLQAAKPKSGQKCLLEALNIYKHKYHRKHLRIAQTWAQLALHQLDFGRVSQHVNDTIAIAFRHFYPRTNDTLLYPYAAKINYVQSLYYWMNNRDYQTGLEYGKLAEQLILRPKWVDVALLARVYCARGLCLSRERDFYAVDSLLKRGLNLLQREKKNSIFTQEMYRHLLINAAVWQDASFNKDSLFRKYWFDLHQYLHRTKQPQSYAQSKELRAFYYYVHRKDSTYRKKCLLACWHLRQHLKANPDVPFSRYYNEMVLNTLAEVKMYNKKYKAAAYYWLMSFKGTDAQDYDKITCWKDAFDTAFTNRRINPFFSFSKAGNIFLKRFQDSAQVKDLCWALRLYEMADKLMSVSLKMSQDGVLSYQYEVGGEVYQRGLEAVFEAWQLRKKYPDKFPERKLINLAFRLIERQKSFLLFRDDLLGDQFTRKKVKDIKKTVRQITDLRLQNQSTIKLHELCKTNFIYQEQLNVLHEFSKERLEQKIADFQEIQQQLNEKQVLVQYKVFPKDKTYLLALSKHEYVLDTVGKTDSLHNEVERYWQFLKEDFREYAPAMVDGSKILYKKLIQPFQNIIPKKDAELVIVPDRFLTDIPFEAFPLPDAKPVHKWKSTQYLLHRYFVVYTPSWKIWTHHQLTIEPLHKKHTAAFFSYTIKGKLIHDMELYWARKEYQGLSRFFKTTPFTGSACSKENFTKLAYRYKLLFLSLHGKIDRTNLNANKLFFKVNGKNLLDSISGSQIADLPLDEKWAIISACDTGTGIHNAEGIYSLARAFQQAGCEFVISSLWEIPDQTTSIILTHFIRYLKKGDLPWIALTKAKRKFMEDNNESFPNVWAGMIPIM